MLMPHQYGPKVVLQYGESSKVCVCLHACAAACSPAYHLCPSTPLGESCGVNYNWPAPLIDKDLLEDIV